MSLRLHSISHYETTTPKTLLRSQRVEKIIDSIIIVERLSENQITK